MTKMLSSRTVEANESKLIINFEYDKFIVSLMSMFPGKKFMPKKPGVSAYWTIPIQQVESVVNILSFYSFTFSTPVMVLFNQARKYKDKIQRIKDGKFTDIEIEALGKLEIPFYDYQKIGVGFECAGHCILLADEPGLGKTVQTLSATKIRQAKKVLIFCPKSAKKTWEEEIEKWLGKEKTVIISGTPAIRQKLWESDSKYYISNYHQLLNDHERMKKIPWDFIIADEATDISNPQAKMTRRLKELECVNKIALTGTPISNTIKDIWSIMDWVRPGLLGTYWDFVKEYCIANHFGQIVAYKNLDKLRVKIEPYFLRRLKADVLKELPPKTYENIYTEFSPEEARLYKAIKEEITTDLIDSGMLDRGNLGQVFVKMVRLKQMTDSSELVTGEPVSSKLDDLKDLLKIVLAGDRKALVFTQFKEMAVILMRELDEYKPLLIAGGVSEKDRDDNRHMFNEDTEHKLLIMTSAGSRALNLQRATSVIHYDLPWSIDKAIQREDRAHRSGQTENVTVYRMMVRDTIDEYNLKVLFRKGKTSRQVLGDPAADIPAHQITRGELLNLLK